MVDFCPVLQFEHCIFGRKEGGKFRDEQLGHAEAIDEPPFYILEVPKTLLLGPENCLR